MKEFFDDLIKVLAACAGILLLIILFGLLINAKNAKYFAPWIIPISIIVILFWAVWVWNYAIVYLECYWCGKLQSMFRKDYRWYIRTGVDFYCSGHCKRADEASQGVKEKRYRIIDHE